MMTHSGMLAGWMLLAGLSLDQPWPMIDRVDRQPLLAQTQRIREALATIGAPLPDAIVAELESLKQESDAAVVTRRVQEIFDPLAIAAVELSDEQPPRSFAASRPVTLVEQGWRAYLIKVLNRPGLRTRLRVDSPQARPLPHSPADDVGNRFLALSLLEGQPLLPDLGGLELEYRVLEMFAKEPGHTAAQIEFAAPVSQPDIHQGDRDQPRTLVGSWRFDSGTDGWKPLNEIDLEARDGSLHLSWTGVDPFIGIELDRPARPGNMVLRFWGKSDQSAIGQIFWWTEDRPAADPGRSVNFNLEADVEQLYEVPINVEGYLTGLRLDPAGSAGKMRIDWIELTYADKGGDWTTLPIALEVFPAETVTFRVTDKPGLPAMARFEITDAQGRIYPPQNKRLAPDFFFQRQIYRGDGETIRLPRGTYTIRASRGPETIPEVQTLIVGSKEEGPATVAHAVQRWIDPSDWGYWSGDHHIHAAGCAHYENPTEGVAPADMIRHTMGEDLKVGCCLTWGPCFDFQKRFFSAKVDDLSRYPYILRYDIEVSGFGSHASGHLNLLRLQEQIPPGGDSKEHWPTLGLNTLRWAKAQGAVCGPAHSSAGLQRAVRRLEETEGLDGPNRLPNFDIPAYDGIGANEFIMNVAHTVPGPDGKPIPAVDFISTMNTDRTTEFNMWYHVLNAGFRVRVSGETDFPCMSGERVGIGRVYAKVDGELDFDRWCDSIAAGRSYVSDGEAHLIDFRAVAGERQVEVGVTGSELALDRPGTIEFVVRAAARKPDAPTLPVECVVNGYPVASQSLVANGHLEEYRFSIPIEQSSWVAIRIFPYAHSNPIFVPVAGEPILPSADSVRWCLAGVDQCWESKRNTYRSDEQPQAQVDYDHAREVYRTLLERFARPEAHPK